MNSCQNFSCGVMRESRSRARTATGRVESRYSGRGFCAAISPDRTSRIGQARWAQDMAQLTARFGPGASYVLAMTEFLLDESAWPATLTQEHRERLRAVRDGLRSTPDLLGLAVGGSFI